MSELTIIVPVYNVVEYIEECLRSVINQTKKDIEIIIVDDGSTDGSTEICQQYANIDSRIKFIRQENAGAAAARKKAAEYAEGKYMGFVDADDVIVPDLFERLLVEIQDCDLVTSGYKRGEKTVLDKLPEGIYHTEKQMNYLLDNMLYFEDTVNWGIICGMVAKVFRTDIAKEVFSEIHMNLFLAEDGEFLYRYILKCRSVSVTNICGYYYRMRENSTVHSVNRNFLRNVSDFYDSLESAFQNSSRRDMLIPRLQYAILRMLTEVNQYMGFMPNVAFLFFQNPFTAMLSGKKVALYGAGVVGYDYYLHMVHIEKNEPVVWVDKMYQKYQDRLPVSPVEQLLQVEFDYLVIAIEDEKVAQAIRFELLQRGIAEEKILWKKPMNPIIRW